NRAGGGGGGGSFDVARGAKIGSASTPGRITVGRALPLASGAAIRLPPERNTLFFTARGRDPAKADAPDGLVSIDGAPPAAAAAAPGAATTAAPTPPPEVSTVF